MIACPDCGLLEKLPPLSAGTNAVCSLCHADLERTSGRSVTAGLACALGTFFLLFPGNILLLMSVRIFGMHNENRLSSGIFMLWDHGWLLLAAMTGAFAVILPFIRFGILSIVLATVRLGRSPWWLGPAYRWALWLDVWAMPDVYILAGFVGYYRLINAGPMQCVVHAGGYCFLAAGFLAMISRASIDRRTVWRAVGPEADITPDEETVSCTTCDLVQPIERTGHDCPRCGARLHTRKPQSLMRATAFTIAAFVLFFPANILPMNTTVQMGSKVDYTIFQGVHELFKAGLWPLGVIIFCTSIGIPGLKILGMGWLLISTQRKSRQHLIGKTRFHRFITEIGRWSNVDPFTITVFVPLMTFGAFASSKAGWGSTAFILVVVLTLLATMSFDSRLMWDAAEEKKTA
ncbi:MAG TPA: paraquat-inducible protein A [Chthoniobacterales bacterium]|jgi:paraquat-inducible protein A